MVWNVAMAGRMPLPLVVDLDVVVLAEDPALTLLRAAGRGGWGWRRGREGRRDRRAVALGLARPALPLVLRVNRAVADAVAVQRRIGGAVLALTACDTAMARAAMEAAGLEIEVLGSDPGQAMTKGRRRLVVQALFGPRGFAYCGAADAPGPCDLARRASLAGASEAQVAAMLTRGVPVRRLSTGPWHDVPVRAGPLAAGQGPSGSSRISAAFWAADDEGRLLPESWPGRARPQRAEALQIWRALATG